MAQVRLTRKLADFLNGIDLSRRQAGDVFDLPQRDANVLIAEGWASAADRPPGRNKKRKKRKS